MITSENTLALQIDKLKTRFPNLQITIPEDKIPALAERYDDGQLYEQLILECLSFVSVEEPDWTYAAAILHAGLLYQEAAQSRSYDPEERYGSFHGLLRELTELGIYSSSLLEAYTESDISELQEFIVPERDGLFTYIGIKMLSDRYLARSRDGRLYELPQERFMIIAMTLMMKEKRDKRLTLVKEAYWAMSNLYMTVATPTLSNAGKTWGQLSSCFIETVDDSLDSIYDSNTDIAALSKNGGGIGVYMGKIRSHGSDIKGFKGASSGVIPWMKQLNNTAVSVDQLGQRQGAISVYLDVWHKDIFSFLDAKLNNGDERLRTHDLFTGVCIPDCFMEAVKARGEWHLFDPHEVRKVMGFSLEDYYDEEKGSGSFRSKYGQCINEPRLSRKTVPAIDIMKSIMRSQLETGTPFMFYRDEVNRKNANPHAGMIYCTNLCTEITQNQSPTIRKEEYVDEGRIIIEKVPGDFVVCNLSSINLAKAIRDGVLERLISIEMRMLDNVIDINTIPVLQGGLTNQKYRAVGLGTFGWHHLLAIKKIKWESQEAIDYADYLYEKIAYHTIKESILLAKEKGAYPAFQGSDWENGAYFEKRGYNSKDSGLDWDSVKKEAAEYGIRNGYLLAVAPNASTALIAGSTPSIDPIYRKQYSEEKKNYRIPVTAPDLNAETTWYYKSANTIDQSYSIKQNAKRQKHIDQAISFNIYIRNTIKAVELLNYHLEAWEEGLKTTYYVRSTSSDIEECESCSS